MRKTAIEIDVTPLIDVLFMLIIFFVLTTSFMQGRIEVELPDGSGAPAENQSQVLVTLKRDGSFLWGDTPVTSDEVFSRAAEASVLQKEILVAGDREVPYGDVAGLLDMLRSAGLKRVGLALKGDGNG